MVTQRKMFGADLRRRSGEGAWASAALPGDFTTVALGRGRSRALLYLNIPTPECGIVMLLAIGAQLIRRALS